MDCAPDLPAEWACATALSFAEVSPQCSDFESETPVQAHGQVTQEHLELTIGSVLFREEQEICGYLEDESGTPRVLLQPCDMHPEHVIRGNCLYSFVVQIATTQLTDSASAVEVWRRDDFYGDVPDVVPKLIAVVQLE